MVFGVHLHHLAVEICHINIYICVYIYLRPLIYLSFVKQLNKTGKERKEGRRKKTEEGWNEWANEGRKKRRGTKEGTKQEKKMYFIHLLVDFKPCFSG